MENLENFIICMTCEGIKLREGSWLKREDNPILYNRFRKQYEESLKLTHGYCHECEEKANKEFFGK